MSTAPVARHDVLAVDDLTRTQIVQYAGASGDFNPIHTDEVYATRAARRESVIAHGMLTMGIVGRVLTTVVDEDSIRAFGGRFTAPVLPGDSLHVTVEHDGANIRLAARNQDGTTVFTGYATVAPRGTRPAVSGLFSS